MGLLRYDLYNEANYDVIWEEYSYEVSRGPGLGLARQCRPGGVGLTVCLVPGRALAVLAWQYGADAVLWACASLCAWQR